jgi:hypothetical protein
MKIKSELLKNLLSENDPLIAIKCALEDGEFLEGLTQEEVEEAHAEVVELIAKYGEDKTL